MSRVGESRKERRESRRDEESRAERVEKRKVGQRRGERRSRVIMPFSATLFHS